MSVFGVNDYESFNFDIIQKYYRKLLLERYTITMATLYNKKDHYNELFKFYFYYPFINANFN